MKQRLLVCLLLTALAACSTPQAAQTLPTPTPRPAAPSLEKPTYTVQLGEVVDDVELSGFVSAVRQQELSFTQNGFLKVLYVERNSDVKKGDLLAELDQGELPNQLRQAEVNHEQAQLALGRVIAENDLAIRRAQLDLEDARGALAKLQEPAEPADIAAAQANLQQAKADLETTRTNASAGKTEAELNMRQAAQVIPALQAAYLQALEDWNDVKDHPQDWRFKSLQEAYLRAEADLRNAERSLEEAKLAFETARQNEAPAIQKAEAAVSQAQAQLDALSVGAKASDLAAARRNVERATLALEEAQRGGGNDELEKQVATAQLELERIQAQIESGRLLAPFDGKISEISKRPGDGVEAYSPLVTIIDDSERELLIESVTTQDAARIGVGLPVQIVFSRHPGQIVNGVITKLPTSATSSASTIDQDTAYHIEYNPGDLELEVGDLGRVTITLAKKDSALWLPPQAVRAFEGRRFVVLKDGERQRRQDVRVGIISDERIEILEGLNEGDIVVGQ